eukprot:jgi/Ulvmu1/10790/UM069_0024.1
MAGAASITIRIGMPFDDPGAIALDPPSGAVVPVLTLGLAAVHAALSATAASMLGPLRPGSATVFGPFPIVYFAQDAEGNESQQIVRNMYVDASCPAGEFRCWELGRCSMLGLCLPVDLVGSSAYVPPVDTYEPPVDTIPPRIQLRTSGGDELLRAGESELVITSVVSGSAFVEPGWEATDDVDGNVATRVTAAGSAVVAAAVATGAPTNATAPHVIRYTVRDAAGNEAVAVRAVHVTCGDRERRCATDDGRGYCSTDAICIPAEETGVTVQDPVLKLRGMRDLFVLQGTPFAKCPSPRPVDLICDLGAAASHPVDGELTPFVDACRPGFRFASEGLLGCTYDTSTPGIYPLTFVVTVPGTARSATATRRLIVYPRCAAGEFSCEDLRCSLAALCVTAPGPLRLPANLAPRLTAAPGTALWAPVPAGVPYSRCTESNSSMGEGVCEAGAVAVDPEEGGITPRVLACPPDSCIQLGCPGHEFERKGLSGCGIDAVGAPPGVSWQLPFVVFDAHMPAARASLTKTITVASPCTDTSHIYCPGATAPCASTLCSIRQDAASPAAPPQPPHFTVDEPHLPPNTWLLPSTNNTHPNSTLLVSAPCGFRAALPLPPCMSDTTTPVDDDSAAASGASVQSMSASCPVTVHTERPLLAVPRLVSTASACSAAAVQAGTCSACSVTGLLAGSCAATPEAHGFELRATDSSGLNATALRLNVSVWAPAAVARVQYGVRISSQHAAAPAEGGIVDSLIGNMRESPLAHALLRALQAALPTADSCAGNLASGTLMHVEVDVAATGPATGRAVSAWVEVEARVAMGGSAAGDASAAACLSQLALTVTSTGVIQGWRAVTVEEAADALWSVAAESVLVRAAGCPSMTAQESREAWLAGELAAGEADLRELVISLALVEMPETADRELASAAHANACVLAEAALEAFASTEAATAQAAEGLGASALLAAVEAAEYSCEAAYRSAALDAAGIDTSPAAGTPADSAIAPADSGMPPLVASLQRDSAVVNTTRVLVIAPRPQLAGGRGGSGTDAVGRRLLARASSKATTGSGAARRAVPSATIAGLGWTTADWDVGDPRRQGPVLVSRYVGLTSVIVGGVLLHQTRTPQDKQTGCEGRYAKLQAQCTTITATLDRQLQSLPINRSSPAPVQPFGVEPAFNPSSPLFTTDAVDIEARFFNTSPGSPDVSIVGYPAAFFPRRFSGYAHGFPVIFPVQTDLPVIHQLWQMLRDGYFIDVHTKAMVNMLPTSVAVITSALAAALVPFLEILLIAILLMASFAMLLVLLASADERLSTAALVSNYMMNGIVTGSFIAVKQSLIPSGQETGFMSLALVAVAQVLLPFIFTIIFVNFVVSILVDIYLRKQRLFKYGSVVATGLRPGAHEQMWQLALGLDRPPGVLSRQSGLESLQPGGRRMAKLRRTPAMRLQVLVHSTHRSALLAYVRQAAAACSLVLRSLRLLLCVLTGSQHDIIVCAGSSEIAADVACARPAKTLLATLRRAVIIAKAFSRGVSLRRASQRVWKVLVPPGNSGAAVVQGSAVFEAHGALSLLASLMLARCKVTSQLAAMEAELAPRDRRSSLYSRLGSTVLSMRSSIVTRLQKTCQSFRMATLRAHDTQEVHEFQSQMDGVSRSRPSVLQQLPVAESLDGVGTTAAFDLHSSLAWNNAGVHDTASGSAAPGKRVKLPPVSFPTQGSKGAQDSASSSPQLPDKYPLWTSWNSQPPSPVGLSSHGNRGTGEVARTAAVPVDLASAAAAVQAERRSLLQQQPHEAAPLCTTRHGPGDRPATGRRRYRQASSLVMASALTAVAGRVQQLARRAHVTQLRRTLLATELRALAACSCMAAPLHSRISASAIAAALAVLPRLRLMPHAAKPGRRSSAVHPVPSPTDTPGHSPTAGRLKRRQSGRDAPHVLGPVFGGGGAAPRRLPRGNEVMDWWREVRPLRQQPPRGRPLPQRGSSMHSAAAHSTIAAVAAPGQAVGRSAAAASTPAHVPAVIEAVVATVLFDWAVFIASGEDAAVLRARRARGRRRGRAAERSMGDGAGGSAPTARGAAQPWLPQPVAAGEAGPLLRHPEVQACLLGMMDGGTGAHPVVAAAAARRGSVVIADAGRKGVRRRRALWLSQQVEMVRGGLAAVEAAHAWVRRMVVEVEDAAAGCRARGAWLDSVFQQLSLL